MTCLPKIKGGLGILDLKRFTRALRLRWLWFQWKQKHRAWNNLDVPCDKTDRELYYASTIVTIGDGRAALFWCSSWLNGTAPRTIAPLLYEKSRRKRITVRQALTNNKWIDHIYPPTSQEEIRQFVSLWEALRDTALSDRIEDNISWKWTADGEYSTSSAYQIQFIGVYSKMRLTSIWKARKEHKCRFFVWTLMHKKILTANNLFKRGWTDDTNLDCKLCGNELETLVHLCKDCPYTKEVWATLRRCLIFQH
jgi:hypothetical protein